MPISTPIYIAAGFIVIRFTLFGAAIYFPTRPDSVAWFDRSLATCNLFTLGAGLLLAAYCWLDSYGIYVIG